MTNDQIDTSEELNELEEQVFFIGMTGHNKVTELENKKLLDMFHHPKDVTVENLPMTYVTSLNQLAKHENLTLDDTLDLLRFFVALKEVFEPEVGEFKPPEDPIQFFKV